MLEPRARHGFDVRLDALIGDAQVGFDALEAAATRPHRLPRAYFATAQRKHMMKADAVASPRRALASCAFALESTQIAAI